MPTPDRVVLCYGDSNTHGTRPIAGPDRHPRFPPHERWPGILRARLGAGWHVIEEGLPARTTVHDDPIEGRHKNGLATLRPCLESHRPVDCIVLMLGTNDCKQRFSVGPADIAQSIGTLLAEIRACEAGPDGATPAILVVSPARIAETAALGAIFAGGAAKSARLAAFCADIAGAGGAGFLDADRHVTASPVDGVHFEPDQHANLAVAIEAAIRDLLPNSSAPRRKRPPVRIAPA